MAKVTIDFICKECEERTVGTAEWSKTLWDDRWDCGACGGTQSIQRIPSPMTTKRVSLPDGNGRFDNLKKAGKIRTAAMDLPREQRGEMLKEAHKLESIKK